MASVSAEKIKHLAEAVGLPLSPDRRETLAAAFGSLLDALKVLDEVDVSGVQPATVFALRPGAPSR